VAGWSASTNGDVTGNHGLHDYWIVKLDIDGGLVWQHSFGGSQDDIAYSAQQTTDGGYIIGGYSESSDDDVAGNHGVYDYWMVKLNSAGDSLWKFCFGGTSVDQPYSVQQTKDAGYIVVGQSNSNNGDVSDNHGGYDFWMLKLDMDANLEWQKSLGGSSDEYGPYGVQQTFDGGYIVGGATLSNDDDVSGNHGGSFYGDCWIVKLVGDNATGISTPSDDFFSIYPNPVQTQLNIDLLTPPAEATVRVYDVQGKIRQTVLSGHTDKVVLNTENLSDGFYTLQITDNKTGKNAIGKFVKQQ
jgi:hypothetical protein